MYLTQDVSLLRRNVTMTGEYLYIVIIYSVIFLKQKTLILATPKMKDYMERNISI